MSDRTPLLVLGLGNVLLEDDGVGAVAVQRLTEEYDVPEDVRVLDGGTLGLALLPYVEDAERLILVDAIRADAPPGTVVRLNGDEVAPAVATRLSPHQFGVSDLLDGARWRERSPAALVLLGIVPQSFELHVGLTSPVQDAVDDLVAEVVAEARALGFAFHKRHLERSLGDGGAKAPPLHVSRPSSFRPPPDVCSGGASAPPGRAIAPPSLARIT